ncbi:hypothetical protein L208DRAFT_1420054 [Tricholoma matsutake]|nr:hypothetical protein L208DRAFT_1420054 [Tricholoma matsutake 945]
MPSIKIPGKKKKRHSHVEPQPQAQPHRLPTTNAAGASSSVYIFEVNWAVPSSTPRRDRRR